MSVKDIGDLKVTLSPEDIRRLLTQAAEQAANPPLPGYYYDSAREGFWMPNTRGGWVRVNESSIKRQLKMAGFSGKSNEREFISPLERAVSQIQTENDVTYASSLAGYESGVYEILGSRVLVTDSPKLIDPTPGEWPMLRAVISGLLNDPEHSQDVYLLGWLKVALESLRSGRRQPGQCLTLAGPRECGKSLLQAIITVMLGGREARPYRYMKGGTEFNADLFQAEHLVIEDQEASTDIRSRRALGAKVKELTVNSAQSCHPKNRQAISLTPFWRLSISVNDEAENLMVLPPLDESLRDKFIILLARKSAMPMPTETAEQQALFWDTLKGEIPHLVHHLLGWEIPVEMRSARFGIREFHHPDVIEALGNLSPEAKLLEIIDGALFDGAVCDAWEGSSTELEIELKRHPRWGEEARKLLSFNTAGGVYLARLANSMPERITRSRSDHKREWEIQPPKE